MYPMKTKKKREEKKSRYSSAQARTEKHASESGATSLSLPEGATLFKLKKEGPHRIDILPYEVGKGNPYADPGDLHFERTYFTHRGIGPEQNTYVCARKTAGKQCPICDYIAKARRKPDADNDALKELEPKERQLWNVLDLSEPDKGPKVWDVSYHLFGKFLDKKIRNADPDDGYEKFFHLEDGFTIKLGVEEKSFAGNTFFTAEDLEFKARKEAYDDDMLEKAFCLDDIPKIVEYDKLKKIFLQEDSEDEDEEDEETPKKKKPAKKKPIKEEDDDEDDDEDEEDEDEDDDEPNPAEEKGIKVGTMVKHKKYGECEVTHVSSDGTSLRIKDDEDEVHKAIDTDMVIVIEDEDEDEEEEKPKKKKPVKKPSKKEEDEDDDDEDDEDEEEEPPAKKKKKPAKDEEDDDEDWEDDDESFEEEEEDEDEDEKPKKKAKK